jgi:transposase
VVIIGVDLHKRSHTAVAADEAGRQLATRTAEATGPGHLGLLEWAGRFPDRRWALEDCRNLSRRLEADLLRAGESVVRVPPKLMAGARRYGREPGKSDPIDALAVARAALREPDLPVACLPGPEREVRLLIDHREDLIYTRTQIESRLRWHLHELGIEEPPARGLGRKHVLARLTQSLDGRPGLVARIARELVGQLAALSARIDALETEVAGLVASLAPGLLTMPGCGPLTAAKIVAETAGISRFRDRAAYARYNGSAPVPVWSGEGPRHRLSRGGNRQLNAAIHRIAISQIRFDCAGSVYFEMRQKLHNNTKREAIRALRRRVSDEVYRRLRQDETARDSAAMDRATAAPAARTRPS